MRHAIRIGCALLALSAYAGDRSQPVVHPLSTGAPVSRKIDVVCDQRVNSTLKRLLECVHVNGVRTHLLELDRIAREHDGTRVSGSPGYDASVDYVRDRLVRAGYEVTLHEFDFEAWRPLGPSTLVRTAPSRAAYVELLDFGPMLYGFPGDVEAPVTAVDPQLDTPSQTTSGCQAADFDGFPAGHIALIQRGGCGFRQKADLASAAGASAVILYNQGNGPTLQGLFRGTLGSDFAGGIPVVATTFPIGAAWVDMPDLRLHLVADVFRGPDTTVNLIADLPGGREDSVIVVGAHLDSVPFGPGIQDNGSGSAAILEVALQLKGVTPVNKLRFAWWGAEEFGLVGSNAWVDSLGSVDRSALAAYLNFDMIASPNGVPFVLDGDGSALELAGPPGSDRIEATFTEFYESRGISPEPTGLSFRSDYAAFFNAGVPFGGLFTGAEGRKTAAQARRFGGVAGQAYDPCYHESCDVLANVGFGLLDLNADAIASVVFRLATAPEPFAGAEKRDFRPPRIPARPHPDYAER